MCYIPEMLIGHRILGKDRMEPCSCGHYHFGKEVIIPPVTAMAYMDMLVAKTKAEETVENIQKLVTAPRFKEIPKHWLDK